MNIEKVKAFIYSLYCDDGKFRFYLSGHANIFSTCFAVLVLDLINELDNFSSKEKEKIKVYIKNFQDPISGFFIDKKIKKRKNDFHNQEYVDLQITDFAILALDILGEKPRYPLVFLEKYKDEKYVKHWLEHLNWKDPWKESNLVMFILNFLIFENKEKNNESIIFILDWLDKKHDGKNGLWNMGHRINHINQLAGAYHFLFFYTYLERRPQYVEKIIDSVLSVQNYDGLFTYWGGGGSCEDLDAIDLLCRATFYTDYRKEEIKIALQKSYNALLENQNNDGGFCWAKRNKISFKKIMYIFNFKLLKVSLNDFMKNAFDKSINQIMVVFFPSKLNWKYSGIETMKIQYNQSDIWSTWFRLLAIAFIEKTFPDLIRGKQTFNWKMRNKPGLGFYK